MIPAAALLAALTLLLPGDGWTAAGWMANPSPAPAPVDPNPDPSPDPGSVPPPRPTPPPPPVGPSAWQLADATGQVWTHPDKAYLEAFVAERNRQFTAPPAFVQVETQSFAPSSCTVDQFGRRRCFRR